MNIPGSIEAELKAAREEGRREGLREAIAICESREAEANAEAEQAYNSGLFNAVHRYDEIAEAFCEVRIELDKKAKL